MHKTHRGISVDIGKYMAENATKPALGNAKLNARGDAIGPRGEVVKKREDMLTEYNKSNPRAVRRVALKDLSDELFQTPQEAMKDLKLASDKAKVEEAAKTAANAAPKATRKITDAN